MSTDLATTGTQAMTTVEDVTENIQLVATRPEDMTVAQGKLSEWFRAKVEICKKDAADMKENYRIAEESGWKTGTFKRQAGIALKRVEFYEKCLAAVEAGYVIVPNFPVDIFAIRTTKARPHGYVSDSRWHNFAQTTNRPPIGKGEYVSPTPTESQQSWEEKNDKGQPVTKREWSSDEWAEVEFPISIAQPTVMGAAQAAMDLGVFDAIGGLPARRKSDPIVVGLIYPPNASDPLAFLIAWWIDTRQLP